MNKFEFIATGVITPILRVESNNLFVIEQSFIVSVHQERQVNPVRTLGGQVLDFAISRDCLITFKLLLPRKTGYDMVRKFETKNNYFVLYNQQKFWVTSYNFSDNTESPDNIDCTLECRPA